MYVLPFQSCAMVNLCPLAGKTEFSKEHIIDVEKWIDEYTENLPPLQNFILPVSGPANIYCRAPDHISIL